LMERTSDFIKKKKREEEEGGYGQQRRRHLERGTATRENEANRRPVFLVASNKKKRKNLGWARLTHNRKKGKEGKKL